MKILFSDNTLWGLINFRIGIINRFVEQGYEVVLVAPADSMCEQKSIPAKARYIEVALSRTGTNPLADLRYYRALKAIYKAERPDYIFHYTIKPNIYGTLAAKSLGISSSAMIAGLGHVYTKKGLSNTLARLMYKYAMRYPKQVMVLNSENYNILLERKVVDVDRLLLLQGGEGIDLEAFKPLPYPQNERPIFLMVARVLYEKGYRQYVEAARVLKGSAIFRLMGPIDTHPSAVPRSEIEARVADGTIEYIEFSPDVQGQIAQADCIVLPSFHEGLSRILIEALVYERSIITTNIAGCRETVDDGVNGFLIPPKDAQALLDACFKLINLPDKQKQEMGRSGRAKAEAQFDIEHVWQTYKEIIGTN